MHFDFNGDTLAALKVFSKLGQQRVREAFEDAATELQVEMLERALLSEHTAEELVAFADAIRGLPDPGIYESCTLHSSLPEDFTVTQLLRAESDPLFAYELKGNHIDPPESFEAALVAPAITKAPRAFDLMSSAAHRIQAQGFSGFDSPTAKSAAGKSSVQKKSSYEFEADSPGGRTPLVVKKNDAMEWGNLGGRQAPAPAPPPSVPSTKNAKLIEDLLNDFTRTLSVSWKESDIDLPGGLKLSDAVHSAFGALSRGIPVPVAIGPNPGQHKRFAIFVQVSSVGKVRAFQMYEPVSNEILWMNEGDLLLGRELPFRNKVNRRLTRIVLPQSARGAYSY
jgi:hypothetical protein